MFSREIRNIFPDKPLFWGQELHLGDTLFDLLIPAEAGYLNTLHAG